MGVKIHKRDGKWYVFVNCNGRRKAKCVGTSRELAEHVRRRLEAKLALGDLGFLAEPSGLTFEEYSQRWLKQYAEVELKSSTVNCYAQFLRLYVLPRFGQFQVTAIQRTQVKDFLGELSAKGKLSRNTLRLILCTLRVILNHAIEDGVLDITQPRSLAGSQELRSRSIKRRQWHGPNPKRSSRRRWSCAQMFTRSS